METERRAVHEVIDAYEARLAEAHLAVAARQQEMAMRLHLGRALGVDPELRQWSPEEMRWLLEQIRLFEDGRTDHGPGVNAAAPVLLALLTGAHAALVACGGLPWPVKLVCFFVALYVVAFVFGLTQMLS